MVNKVKISSFDSMLNKFAKVQKNAGFEKSSSFHSWAGCFVDKL